MGPSILKMVLRQWCKKSVITELSIDGGGFFSRLAAEGNFTENILINESASSVRDCLSSLKDGYKDLLILKYEMELSYKEIGTLLGFSDATVKTYLYRQGMNLKKCGGRVWTIVNWTKFSMTIN